MVGSTWAAPVALGRCSDVRTRAYGRAIVTDGDLIGLLRLRHHPIAGPCAYGFGILRP
jgi:hypothetical protein